MRFHLTFIILFKVLNINAQTSILSNGEWIKIGVVESGVYKLDKNFFDNHNISLEGVSPDKIKIFGSGYNGALPQLNSLSNIISPKEIQSIFNGNSDSKFDDNEFLYFYLQSSDKIYYDSLENYLKTEKNIYTDTSYYFINIGVDSRKLVLDQIIYDVFDRETEIASHLFNYENDFYSIIQSGREWYGEIFSPGQSLTIPIDNFLSSHDLKLHIDLVSRSTVPSSFDFYLNNSLVSDINMDVVKDNLYGNKVLKKKKVIQNRFELNNSNNIRLIYNGDNSAISYLDKINITGKIELKYNSNQLLFHFLPEHNKVLTKYKIHSNKVFSENLDGKLDLKLWNISDPYSINNLQIRKEGDGYYFINNDSIFSRSILYDISN